MKRSQLSLIAHGRGGQVHLYPGTAETVGFVAAHPGCTASDLATEAQITPRAALMRLRRAQALGLLRCEETEERRDILWYTSLPAAVPHEVIRLPIPDPDLDKPPGRWVRVAAYLHDSRGRLLACEGIGESFEDALLDLRIAERACRWVLVPRKTPGHGLTLIPVPNARGSL